MAWALEGDTPAYLGLIPNGLSMPDQPSWGGWGGRYELSTPAYETIGDSGSIVVPEPETRPIWTNTSDTYTPYGPSARRDWTPQSYAEANHPPVPHLNHPDHLAVKSGERVTLDAFGSSDPDGDSISSLWFNYPEAGTYPALITADGAENVDRFKFTAPKVDKEVTAHFILKLTEKGTSALFRYQRVIVAIMP
jgi:hypothetical protein